jgi:hypothetical protein
MAETVQALVARNRRWQPYQDALHDIYLGVLRMPRRHVERLVADSEKMTRANCGWAAFRLAPIIKRIAEEELIRRDRKRRGA